MKMFYKALLVGALAGVAGHSYPQATSATTILSGTPPSSPTQFLGSSNGYDVILQSNALERMRILSTGAIGIGTSTPSAMLQIHNGVLKLTGANSSGGPMVTFGGSPTVAPGGEWGIEYTTATLGREGLNFWKPFGSTGTGGNDFLFLSNSGKIGINTDNPSAQLTVNGNVVIGDPALSIPNSNYKLFVETGILTEKVKVAIKTSSNWSDFVFQDDYHLTPLAQVNRFIKTEHHLPNIPTTTTVLRDGVDLGEMTASLLTKVEELTLYAIHQDEQIQALRAELGALRSRK